MKKSSRENYKDPFKQVWTRPKHARSQVNGQTRQSQTDMIIESLKKM